MATIISTKTSGVGGLEVTGDASGVLQLASNNGTTAVTIDANQNVGIGTSTLTSAKTTIYSSSGSSDLAATNNAMYLNIGTPATTGNYIRFAGAVTTDLYYGRAVNSDAFVWGKVGIGESMRIDSSSNLQFNSGYGSVATAYGCRAWVNFNGTGTVAIRASGNVTSITDIATGQYTVNFTNAMPDANYSATGGASSSNCEAVIRFYGYQTGTLTVGIVDSNAPAFTDDSAISVAVFR